MKKYYKFTVHVGAILYGCPTAKELKSGLRQWAVRIINDR
jgi:hypothetical protein